ncbi:transposase [Candidatus Enterovibrio escicola]|uniref:transposase n=1 Tax=Candidatus Enterovibrio escicola TaxID=1927127 RepID=UPI001237C71C|nr:transposase [Candidatus Enterovibrio escacola]
MYQRKGRAQAPLHIVFGRKFLGKITGSGIKFNSTLVSPYLKRTKNYRRVYPLALSARGISTGDMQPALESLLGKQAKRLSANSVSRRKQPWEAKYDQWRKLNLSKRRYVYILVDGIYCKVRMMTSFVCLLSSALMMLTVRKC